MRSRTGHEMDMCSGPLLGNILRFSFPLMLSSLLQLLYNAADVIVVGRYAGSTALAAVGSTSSLINLLVNFFLNMSVGTSVVVARRYGAGDHTGVSRALHTSVAVSALFGACVAVGGFIVSRPLLEMMGSPEDVIDQAALYLKIYFIGIPASMVYNFSSAAMRAVGDTKRPLYYLSISGLVNVILNLIFVVGFNMSVAGVAAATALSQLVAVSLILVRLLRSEDSIRLIPRNIRIDVKQALDVFRIGFPAGLQSVVFNISNVLIQSSINSFGSTVMAANAAASNVESFSSTARSAISQAGLTFTGQNIGAKQYRRIPRILIVCAASTTVASIIMSVGIYGIGPRLLGLYTTEAAVVTTGMIRMKYLVLPGLFAGYMDLMASMMRGCGYSFTPMLVSVMGACVFRVIWIYTVFAANHTLPALYVSYPISWALTALVHFVCFLFVWKKIRKRIANPLTQQI